MTRWTKEEIENLTNLYSKMPAKQVAKKLNRSYISVTRKAFDLKLKSYLHSYRKCKVKGCKNKSRCLDLCDLHYKRKWAKENEVIYKKNKKEYYNKNKESINSKKKKYRCTIEGRFAQGKGQANRKNIKWNITLEEYENLMKDFKCYYCGEPLKNSSYSLDRMNNKLDYTKINCVPCCSSCNYFKRDYLSSKEMTKIVKLLKQLRNKESIWETNDG